MEHSKSPLEKPKTMDPDYEKPWLSYQDPVLASKRFMRNFDNFGKTILQDLKEREDKCAAANSELMELHKSIEDDMQKYTPDMDDIPDSLLETLKEIFIKFLKVNIEEAELHAYQMQIFKRLNELSSWLDMVKRKTKGFTKPTTTAQKNRNSVVKLVNAEKVKNSQNFRLSQCSLPYFSNSIDLNINRLLVDSFYELNRFSLLNTLYGDLKKERAKHNEGLCGQMPQNVLVQMNVSFEMPEIIYPTGIGKKTRINLLLNQLYANKISELFVKPKLPTVTEHVGVLELFRFLYAIYIKQGGQDKDLDVKKLFKLLRTLCTNFFLHYTEKNMININ